MPDMQILGFEIRFLAFMSTLEIVTYICDVSAGKNRNKQILGAQCPPTHTHTHARRHAHTPRSLYGNVRHKNGIRHATNKQRTQLRI